MNFKTKNLNIEIINNITLTKKELCINSKGLINSKRQANDGFVFFGYETKNKKNTNPKIDFLLITNDKEITEEEFNEVHFQIRYCEINDKYYIKDLENGFGTFIKMIDKMKITNNFIINIGETFIVFTFNNSNEKELNINVFTKGINNQNFCFNSNRDSYIIIGRNDSCDIKINDKLISQMHCIITYSEFNGEEDCDFDNEKEECGWFIKDGNLDGKKSTNDTWYFSKEELEIYDDMIFKNNHNIFKCVYD